MKTRVFPAIFALLSIFAISPSHAQTTLAPGDLSFVGFNSALASRDGFAFVLWVPISAGTTIKFTDDGFNGTSASNASGNLRELEQTITWTSSTSIAAGTVIRIEGDGASTTVTNYGTVSVQNSSTVTTAFIALTNNGDNFFAYQGNYGVPNSSTGSLSGTALFLVGYQGIGTTTGFLTTGLTGSSTSYLPSDLASFNLFFASSAAAAEYTGPRSGLTMSQYKAAVNNTANWTLYLSPNGVNAYNLTAFTTATAPTITGNPANRMICSGSNTTFSITASGATSYQWQVNSGSGFGNVSAAAPYSGTTTSTLTITGATSIMNGYLYRCVATNATGSTNSTSASLTVSTVAATTSYATVSCNGGSNGTAAVSASGGVGPYTYSWAPSGGTAATASGLSAGSYTCTITDNLGCQATKNFTITQPAALMSSVTANNAACTGVNNGSATINAFGGIPSYTYNWSSSAGTSATATNLAAGSYTVTITDANTCTRIQNVTIGTNSSTQTAGIAGVAGGAVTTQTANVGDASGTYLDGNCNRITKVQPSGANPVSGSITTKLWLESSVPYYGASPYVARHYEITPAVNASTVTGTVTLYFLQAEFDAFNAAPGSNLKLPTGPSDAAGIARLRIGKYSGTSSDNSGTPGSYTGSRLVIDPDDASIVWNSTAGRWEVSFATSGFSGFFAQSSPSLLPVKLVDFTAEKSGDKVLLKWKTASETNSSHFAVEYSASGQSFATIGTVKAAGNSSDMINYSFVDKQPQQVTCYYRIRQVDNDGHSYYSDIRKLNFEISGKNFTLVGNTVEDGQLEVQFNRSTTAIIYNASGQVLRKMSVRPCSLAIDVSTLSKGVYLLQAGGETRKFVIK